MATLTFTSFSRGATIAPAAGYTHGMSETTRTVHTWGGFSILAFSFPDRRRSVFLPRAYLIAKLAAGEVPADYGVDLAEGVFYQRHVRQRQLYDEHPERTSSDCPSGKPAFYPTLDAMTLTFTQGEDDPQWTGGQFMVPPHGVTVRFTTPHGLHWTYLTNDYRQDKLDTQSEGPTSLFGAVTAQLSRAQRYRVWLSQETQHALSRGDHVNGVARKLALSAATPWPLPDAPVPGRRKIELDDDTEKPWRFPANRFELGSPLLAYGLSPDGARLRPYERTDDDYGPKAPDDGGGRLYVHYGRDAWRFLVALPGRRGLRERHSHAPLWLEFFHVFGLCVRHAEVTEKVSPFRGLPLADQQRIWAVPGMSSALSHCLHGVKARLSQLAYPRDQFQGMHDPKHGVMAVFYDSRHPWVVECRRGVRRNWDEVMRGYGDLLGNSRFVRDGSAVQPVAPSPLTRGRLIDL